MENNPKKINLLCVAIINVDQWNAAPIHFFSVADQLAYQKNTKCYALFPRSKNIQKIKNFISSDLTLIEKFSLKKWHLPHFILTLFYIPSILWIIWRFNIHAVYLRMNLTTWMVSFFIRLFSKAKIITEHNGWVEDELHGKKHKIVTFFARKFQLWDAKFAHKVRVVVKGLEELLISYKIKKEKIFIIGNGTNTKLLYPIERLKALSKKKLSSEKIYLGFIGNIAYWQGVHFLIQALAQLTVKHSNLHLFIIGDGPVKNQLIALATQLDLNNFITFSPNIDMKEALIWFNIFDIALFSPIKKRNERIGLSPLKIRDYAATGRPVIAANIKGIKLPDSQSWLITHIPENIKDLCAKIENLIYHPEKREAMKKAARIYAEKNFDWSQIAFQIYRQFTEIISS